MDLDMALLAPGFMARPQAPVFTARLQVNLCRPPVDSCHPQAEHHLDMDTDTAPLPAEADSAIPAMVDMALEAAGGG